MLLETLTRKELAVFMAVGDGLTQDAIAARLECSVGTVKSRLQSMRKKLGAATPAHALAIVYRDALSRAGGIG